MSNRLELIYKGIIQDMSEGVMIIGLDGIIQYLNPAAKTILDKAEEELLKNKVASLFFDNERNDQFSQTILDAISDSSNIHYNLVPYYTKTGKKIIYVMTSFLRSDDKKLALIVILNDMTSIVAMRKRYADQMQTLLDSLVQALSVAIDERSHYNARHTQNMVGIAEAFLDWMDKTENPWRFDEKKKHAFLMSVWLHDVGKLSVPLKVMDKSTRLADKLDTIEDRFGRIHLLDRIALLEGRISQNELESRENQRDSILSFIRRINTAGFLSDEDRNKVLELAGMKYTEENMQEHPLLTDEETSCLLIQKGTLTDAERNIMQNHVVVTRKILDSVSFPDDYSMVPEWAGSHHELKNGKGYPLHESGDKIPKEVCLLTILDIFEALTAKDRPYKKPMSAEVALSVLHSMADEGSIDSDILCLFEKSKAWQAII